MLVETSKLWSFSENYCEAYTSPTGFATWQTQQEQTHHSHKDSIRRTKVAQKLLSAL